MSTFLNYRQAIVKSHQPPLLVNSKDHANFYMRILVLYHKNMFYKASQQTDAKTLSVRNWTI